MLWHQGTQDLNLKAKTWSQSPIHTNMKGKSAVTEGICVSLKAGDLPVAASSNSNLANRILSLDFFL